MDLLKRGSDWLQRTRKRYASTRVTYQRVSASVRASATIGRATYTVTDSDGFAIEVQAWDFIIDRADLEIDDQLIEPARGDRIIVGEPDDAEVYELMPIGGAPVWQWSDSFAKTYRIHTKHVGRQPPQR